MLRNYRVKMDIGFPASELPDFVERAKKRQAASERAAAKKMKMLNDQQPSSAQSEVPKPNQTSGGVQKLDVASCKEPEVVDGHDIPKGCSLISKPHYVKPGTTGDAPIIHYPKSRAQIPNAMPSCTQTSGALQTSEELAVDAALFMEPGTKVVDGHVIPKPGTTGDAPIIHYPQSRTQISKAKPSCTQTSGAMQTSENEVSCKKPGAKVVHGFVIPEGCTVISKPRYAKPGTTDDAPIIYERRYPKRNIPKVCYAEENLPAEDEYYYCPDCKTRNLGLICPEHGFLFKIKDNPVPKYCKDRAFRSIPYGLEIRKSNIPHAGMGVFVSSWLPRDTIIGPYEGRLIKNSSNEGGYCWEVVRDDRKKDCIDAEDMKYSNWTRFINAANHMKDQNLEPFQYKGQIFFRTNVNIRQGQELYTWYGEDYMRELGIDMDNYFSPKPKPPKLKRLLGNKCTFCFLNFTCLGLAQRHVHVRHGSEQGLLVVQYKATLMFPPSTYDLRQLVPAAAYTAKKGPNGLFACPVCDKKTNVRQILVNHIRTHTNERSFKCEFCSKAFTRAGGGLGGTRRGGPDVNIKLSGREDNERARERCRLERDRAEHGCGGEGADSARWTEIVARGVAREIAQRDTSARGPGHPGSARDNAVVPEVARTLTLRKPRKGQGRGRGIARTERGPGDPDPGTVGTGRRIRGIETVVRSVAATGTTGEAMMTNLASNKNPWMITPTIYLEPSAYMESNYGNANVKFERDLNGSARRPSVPQPPSNYPDEQDY